jgi:GT2 family glycosyltransferase
LLRRVGAVSRRLTKNNLNLQLARHHVRQKQWALARSYYDRILSDPNNHARLEMTNVVNEARTNVSVIDRITNLAEYKRAIKAYQKARSKQPPRIVIYTAISGGYDTLKLPEKPNPIFDYVVFSDTPMRGSGIYDIRPMPYFHEDATRQARYAKTHPHTLLSEYDIAIWVDANIMITGELTEAVARFALAKEPVAGIPHPLRKSAIREAYACIRQGKDDTAQIKLQIEHLKRLGYDCNDLIESNLMMFKLRSPRVASFFNSWWRELDNYSRRDQLSLNFALDENRLKWLRLTERPVNARNHSELTLVQHAAKQLAILELERLLAGKRTDPFKAKSFASVRGERIAAQRDRRIDIVYCVHNALSDVKICLDSVVKNRKGKNQKLIIVDDGSDKPTADFLKQFTGDKPWVSLLRNGRARGYTKAANKGLKRSRGELVILLNSDTVVTDGWAEKMADAVFSTPGAGIVGPLSSAASHQSIPNHTSSGGQTATNDLPPGLTAEDLNKYCEKWSSATFVPRVPLVHGFCMGIAREVIERVGYFDERSFPNGYGEENDYCFRATDAGFSPVLATNTYIFHAKSKSYPTAQRLELMKNGSAKFKEIYGEKRVVRAILTMQKNPILVGLRKKAAALYRK